MFDQVMAQDRRYFTENPDAGRYVRDYVRGEAYPGDSGLPWCVRVQVRQLAPGLRIRHFLSQWDDPTVWAVNPEHDYLVLDEDLG